MLEGTHPAGASGNRTPREGVLTEWKKAHTVALVGLIVAIFVVGLIPSNQVIPGFSPPEHWLIVWLIIHGAHGNVLCGYRPWDHQPVGRPPDRCEEQDVPLQIAAALVDRV